MNKDNFDFENEIPETKSTKYSDLDLGLDFDLSFLDDIDESVLEEESPVEELPKEAPKPVKKAAPAKKVVDAEVPAKKVKKPVQKEQTEAPKKKAPPVKKAAPAVEQSAPAKKQKKGPRVGSVIFYTIYFLFILAFFGALYLGLNWLHGWLSDFEAAQPTLKAKQVFEEVFTDPDWGALYEAAGAKDSPYEGKEEYVNYMEEKVGDAKLTYVETSAGLDKTKKKFIVKLGDEKVATFTLTDRNNVGNMDLTDLTNLENIKDMADIPDWQLGAVEVFFERVGTYYIVKMGDHTASINGVALDDSFTIQKATTVAERYLPEGTNGFITCIQQIDGLMEVPDVTIVDGAGNPLEVTYDEAARTFTAKTESNTMTEDQSALALEAAKIYSLWMIDEEHDRAAVAKYFDASSDAYSRIVKSTELWMQNHNGYRFENDAVTDYARYSDDIFSVRVKTDLIVTRTDGSNKVYAFNQSMFFQKNEAGKWLCFESTNVDVSEPVGKVRLSFMQGDVMLTTDFYETDAKEVITPKLPVPEGQVFSGWVTIGTQEDGTTVYNLEFQPSEDGTVKLPEGNTLRPMTLYALFQDASEAAAAMPAEAPAEEAPTEAATEAVTEAATEPATEPATVAATEPVIETTEGA
ncbi:MAG: hypothetical protein U0N82_13520 [Oscillospiraceae bacterium]